MNPPPSNVLIARKEIWRKSDGRKIFKTWTENPHPKSQGTEEEWKKVYGERVGWHR